jgi:hypothetical protein
MSLGSLGMNLMNESTSNRGLPSSSLLDFYHQLLSDIPTTAVATANDREGGDQGGWGSTTAVSRLFQSRSFRFVFRLIRGKYPYIHEKRGNIFGGGTEGRRLGYLISLLGGWTNLRWEHYYQYRSMNPSMTYRQMADAEDWIRDIGQVNDWDGVGTA